LNLEARIWRHFDFALLSATFALIAFGLAMIFSATYGTEPGATVDPRVIRQMACAGAGLGMMVLLVGLDYRLLANLAGPLYAGAVAALLVVLVLGRLHYGAQRWIDLGFFQLQPSEPAKLLIAVALARYFALNRERVHLLRTILV